MFATLFSVQLTLKFGSFFFICVLSSLCKCTSAQNYAHDGECLPCVLKFIETFTTNLKRSFSPMFPKKTHFFENRKICKPSFPLGAFMWKRVIEVLAKGQSLILLKLIWGTFFLIFLKEICVCKATLKPKCQHFLH